LSYVGAPNSKFSFGDPIGRRTWHGLSPALNAKLVPEEEGNTAHAEGDHNQNETVDSQAAETETLPPGQHSSLQLIQVFAQTSFSLVPSLPFQLEILF
jgi:hypothetical protein